MIIGWVGSSKKLFKREKMFNFSVYHLLDQQGCVTPKNWFKVIAKAICKPTAQVSNFTHIQGTASRAAEDEEEAD
jgi:hypothetical protein